MTSSDSIADLRRRLEALEQRVAELEQAKQPGVPKRSPKGMAMNEFLRAFGPTSEVERGLGVAYYLCQYGGLGSFNIEDLRGGLRQAALAEPANISDLCNKLVRKYWFDAVPQKKDDLKAWELTNTGIEEVEKRIA